MACFDSGGRTKWGVFALLAISAIVFTTISTPAYFGILADKSDPESFKGCAHCIQDFGIEVLKTVNATDIADKLQKIHERNEKNHHHGPPHHHRHHHHKEDFDFDDHECITGKDIDDLKPDLEGLAIPDWKEECKDICTPVLKAVPLAAAVSAVLLFVGLISAICSLIPLCMLCCSCKDKSPPVQQWQATYGVPPSASPVGTYNAGPAFAAVGTEDAKMPLLQSKY